MDGGARREGREIHGREKGRSCGQGEEDRESQKETVGEERGKGKKGSPSPCNLSYSLAGKLISLNQGSDGVTSQLKTVHGC